MKSVLLYSGGMDSVICDWLLKPDSCLYVNSGASYSQKEINKISLPAHGKMYFNSGMINLREYEDKDFIVPQRNAFLVLAAAYFGEKIYLGATYGDRSTDKDLLFVCQMTGLLDHMWKKSHWSEGREFSVELPFKDQTKTEMLKKYLETGGNPNRIIDSISCYSSTYEQCGQCKPCARKWVALELNGLKGKFWSNPENYFKPMAEDILKFRYRGAKEDLEIIRAASL